MNISSKAEYGIRALAEIARQPRIAKRSAIAERQRIPLPFLTQVLQALVGGGLVSSSRGPDGGYSLARPATDITLLDVVTLLQGPVTPKPCLGENQATTCPLDTDCRLRDVWQELRVANETILRQTTLADIMRRPIVLGKE